MGRRRSSDLHTLVRSLTPAERGYVRKALAHPLGRKPGAMLELYDLLGGTRDPEGAAIADFLATQPGGGSQLKRNLFDQVIRLLRTVRADEQDRTRVTALIEEALLLADREILVAARDRLLEADTICTHAHLFALGSEVLSGLIRVERRLGGSASATAVGPLLERRRDTLRIAHDLATLGQISATLLRSIQSPDRHLAAEATLALPLIADARPDEHVRIRFWRHHVRAMAHHFLGDIERQDRELMEMVDIIRAHPVFLTEDVSITVLANVLASHIQRRDVSAGRSAHELLNQIQTDVPRLREDLWYNGMRSALYLDLLEGNAEAVISARERIIDGLHRYPTYGTVVQRTWHMLCASAHLQRADPANALIMIRTVLDEPGLPEAHYTAPRCIEIMALIDSGEMEPALYRIRSLERAVEHHRTERPFLHALIRAFKAIARDGNGASTAVAALRRLLRDEIEAPTDRTHRVTIDIDRWIARFTSSPRPVARRRR
jgi:hypothetical protein